MSHTSDADRAPIPSLDALPVFVAVARHGSFSAAATALGLDRSRVSRIIGALERALGVVLFARTTRSVRPTPDGLALLEELGPALATLTRALSRADAPGGPRGVVTLTCSADTARHLVAPHLPGFRRAFPHVEVEVRTTDALVDLADVDLALRLGRPGPASGVARKLADLAAGFYAAPQYLARRGLPRALADLAAHEGLWPRAPRHTAAFQVAAPAPPAAISADFGTLAAVARAGGGVALLPSFLAAADVATGHLVHVLPDAAIPPTPLYLVTRPERPRPPRVAALHSHLVAALAVRGGTAP